MPETKKPMHPLNLPPTGTPGRGFNKTESLWKGRDGVWGREGKAFLQKSFPSLPQYFYFHFYFPINPAISSRRTRAAASAAMRSSSF